MINLSQQLAELSPQKRELLRQQLRHKRNGLAPSPILPRPDGMTVLPLSFAQQRLWFLDRLEPGSSVYNIPAGLRLRGPLDLAALEQSFTEILRRHESLRTTFPAVEEQPVQFISPASLFRLTLLDLRQLAEVDRERQVQHLAWAEAQRPFDLAQGPLFRAALLQLNQNEHVLLLTMHHIISDGWSMSIFFRELSVLYAAFSTGKPSPLPELPVQYADFSLWQRQRLQGEALSNQLAYWKKQLQGAPPILDLPTDRPRLAVSSHHGAGEAILLSKSVTEALKTLSQREGVTLFMTLLAAFQLLLYRYTGQNDLVIGTPIANRTRIEIEGVIGFFLNTLALRLRLSSQLTFQELLGRVREVTLEAYAHHDLPFEKLVEELQPERDLSHTPLFQVWFVLQNAPAHALQLPGLTVTALTATPETAKFDLTLSLEETDRGLQGILGYNTQLFEAATIERMARRFETLLQSIVAGPQQRLLNLRLLSKTEQEQLAAQANAARPTQPFIEFKKEDIEQSISARFAEQVRLYPHHVAVTTRQYEWTYETLHRITNQIARVILDVEGGEAGRTALLFEHDAPMIAGILGALKAGKTYVPLDPAYPRERLAYILADAQASVILTNTKNQALARELSQTTCRLINIDELDLTISPADILLPVPPDALAYILYTSGSTGQPKGVVQNQRNVLHHIRNYTNNLHINSSDRLTLLSSYGFDAAVMDIFGALLNGAALYPLNIKEQSLSDLSRWLIEHKITIYHSTPAVYRYFFGSIPQNDSFPAVRLVVLGGEEVYPKDVALYKKQFGPDCILVNGLGPTESTVSFQYFINHQSQVSGHTVPVGYPVEDSHVLLLDEAGEETVVYGEIAIKSPHVALGYWRRPDLTAAAFPAEDSGNGNRIYRTGDMGRLRPDGKLEFVGRKDFQVKIRGFRVELREIETVLASHPQVHDALVIARQDGLDGQQIVAYVVTPGNKVLDSSELRGFLKLKLPDYMIPAAFVILEAFPLTPNGKINRQALPTPDLFSQGRDRGFTAPRDALEAQLVKIWAAVLGHQEVSVKSNFFEIGGHSLLVVRVIAQIEKILGHSIPMTAFFQAPTAEQLADVIRKNQMGLVSSSSSLVALQPFGSKLPFFCVPGNLGNVFVDLADLARHLGLHQPFYGLQDGLHNPSRIEALAAHYLTEIRSVQPEGPYLLGGVCWGGLVAFEMAQQLHAQGQQVALLVLIEPVPPPFHKIPLYFNILKSLIVRVVNRFGYHSQNLLQHKPLENRAYVGLKTKLVANMRAAACYNPRPFSGRITLLLAQEAATDISADPRLAWQKLTNDMDVHIIPGSHVTITRVYDAAPDEVQAKALADRLQGCLEGAKR